MKDPSNWKWTRPVVILLLTILLYLFFLEKFVSSLWKSVSISAAWMLFAFLTWQVMSEWNDRNKRRYPHISQTTRRLAVTFSGYVVIELLSQGLFFLFVDTARWDWEVVTLTEYLTYLFLCMIMILVVGALYELIYSLNQYGITLQEAEAIKKTALQNEFDRLKNQVNPHFLFNSLNSLSALIDEDRVIAGQFLDELSSVYRYLLHTNDNGLATLKSERDFITSYLFLTQTRYGEAFEADVSIDEKCLAGILPALTLQALVDNAIRYNVVMKQKPLRLSIVSSGQWLEVKNSIQPKHITAAREGLEATLRRFSDLGLALPLVFDDGETFTVKIPIAMNY
ncbi:MAG: histidine kinase [Dyadobacter sp.]|uniref:sensor histidine kinase n=1 Tax=Dyadobacter sp. TaxID=1914288 RepID=UPI00326742FC